VEVLVAVARAEDWAPSSESCDTGAATCAISAAGPSLSIGSPCAAALCAVVARQHAQLRLAATK
jgi:hypothetical protein